MTGPVLMLLVAAASTPVQDAEATAARAVQLSATQPEEALALARKALGATADFEPTAFVQAGRRGEVVEDAYLAARAAYRRHRAVLYAAVGETLGKAGRHDAASRYLRRATLLDPASAPARVGLARALVALGKGRAALDAILAGSLTADALAVAAQAAEAAGIPSLQVEIDRSRVLRLEVKPAPVVRDGPWRVPSGARLSTGAPFRLDQPGTTLLYVAEPNCRTCSEDLETLARLAPAGVRIVVLPLVQDRDEALRRILQLYRHDWPVVVGPGVAAALDLPGGALFVVAREGWAGAILPSPFAATLPAVLDVFGRRDLEEARPRPSWNRRPVDRPAPAPPAGLLPEGLASGEDEPAPEEFLRAVEAYRGRRFAQALAAFEAIEARGDGWLLPPEARLNRALCLAGLGRREAARALLLKTGDSRFQDDVDRTLERVGSSSR
jgi:tetratricopeptide (TPR) repeat protein